MKDIKNFNFIEKRVLVRCDFNVPLDDNGNILDDFRIKQTLPTIKYLIDNKAKVILISHLGEPDGKVVPELRLDKVAKKLAEYLGVPVEKLNDCVGPETESRIDAIKTGEVLLLENLKFHKEEAAGDLEFAEKFSWMCDIYINDAFSECNEIYASIIGIPQYMPSGAGLLLEDEIDNLNKILQNPEKPMAVIVGGDQEEVKLKFIDKISKIADCVMIGGLIKEDLMKEGTFFEHKDKIISPLGLTDSLDIDEKTIKIFCEKIIQAKTILWYGSLGKIEEETCVNGTLAVAKAIIESKAFSVVAGEKIIEFLTKQELDSKFSHVSSGGKALLQYLSGDKLPGLTALK